MKTTQTKIHDLLKESLELGTEALTKEQKKQFQEAIASFNNFGKDLYRSQNMREIAKSVSEIAKMAETLALQEQGEWFDKQTVNKNVRSLQGNVKEFVKTATEAQALQQRLESLYEDMGHVLSRYFHINEINTVEEIKEATNKLTEAFSSSNLILLTNSTDIRKALSRRVIAQNCTILYKGTNAIALCFNKDSYDNSQCATKIKVWAESKKLNIKEPDYHFVEYENGKEKSVK